MIAIGELQLLACLTCGVVVAGYVFYSGADIIHTSKTSLA
jgi:hypothetical protein